MLIKRKIKPETPLSPELKLEQLAKIQNDSSLSVKKQFSGEYMNALINKIKSITIINGEKIGYIDWQLVTTPNLKKTYTRENKKGSKVEKCPVFLIKQNFSKS